MSLFEKLDSSISRLVNPETNTIGVFCGCDNWLKPVSVHTFLRKLGFSDEQIERSKDFFNGQNNVLYCRACTQHFLFEDEYKELYKIKQVTKENESELLSYK